jgi:glucokinase
MLHQLYRMVQKILSYDFGGTKVAVGIVDSGGRILDECILMPHFAKGKDFVLKQLIDAGKSFLSKSFEITAVGVASAGPLDPLNGILLNPTNFGGWGAVELTTILSKHLKKKVFLENDAAAAVIAESRVGVAKGLDNIMVLTLGTGLGTGVICNGKLVRSGGFLHPEAGHMVIRHHDTMIRCGCGQYGCAETYLSGKYFAQRYAKQHDGSYSAIEIAELARENYLPATEAFKDYSKSLTIVLQNYMRIFNPEMFVFAGSFSAASDLFLNQTNRRLARSIRLLQCNIPKLKVSQLKNRSGLIGASFIALDRLKNKLSS